MLCAIYYQKSHRRNAKEMDMMYTVYEQKHQKYRNCLGICIAQLRKLIILLLNIYGITVLSIICVPLFCNFVLKQRMTIMRFIVPLVDDATTIGFIITNVAQATCMIFGGFGNFASDCLIFMASIHIPLKRSILQCKISDLDEISERRPNDAMATKDLLRDILQWHQTYIE